MLSYTTDRSGSYAMSFGSCPCALRVHHATLYVLRMSLELFTPKEICNYIHQNTRNRLFMVVAQIRNSPNPHQRAECINYSIVIQRNKISINSKIQYRTENECEPESHSIIIRNLGSIILGKRICVVISFHTYSVQKQVELVYSVKSQYSILWESILYDIVYCGKVNDRSP